MSRRRQVYGDAVNFSDYSEAISITHPSLPDEVKVAATSALVRNGLNQNSCYSTVPRYSTEIYNAETAAAIAAAAATASAAAIVARPPPRRRPLRPRRLAVRQRSVARWLRENFFDILNVSDVLERFGSF